jgi:transposase-like protein
MAKNYLLFNAILQKAKYRLKIKPIKKESIMSNMDREKTIIPCPGCKKEMEVTYSDIYSRHEAKCRRCGSSMKFNYSATAQFKSILSELGRAQEKVGKAMQKVIETAELTIKK